MNLIGLLCAGIKRFFRPLVKKCSGQKRLMFLMWLILHKGFCNTLNGLNIQSAIVVRVSFHAQSWKSYSSKLRHLQQYVYWTKLKPRRETLSYEYFETSHLSLVMHSHVYKAVRFVTGCSPTQQERTTWGPGHKNIVDFEGKKKKKCLAPTSKQAADVWFLESIHMCVFSERTVDLGLCRHCSRQHSWFSSTLDAAFS